MGGASGCHHLLALDLGETLVRVRALRNKGRALTCKHCSAGEPDVWICLSPTCSTIGCGRSRKGHALQHYKNHVKKTTGTAHAVCINAATLMAWCHACDREVGQAMLDDKTVPEKARKALEALEAIRQTLNPAKASRLGTPDTGDSVSEVVALDELPSMGRRPGLTKGLCGLNNLGNTCYMNSALQALSNAPPLARWFCKCHFYLPSKRRKIVTPFTALMLELWSGKAQPVSPSRLVQDIVDQFPIFRGYGQQDSQEFLRCLLDFLHEELKVQVRTPQKTLAHSSSSASVSVTTTTLPPTSPNGSRRASSSSSRPLSPTSLPALSTSGTTTPTSAHKSRVSENGFMRSPSAASDISLSHPSPPTTANGHRPNHRRSEKKAAADYRPPEPVYESVISEVFQGKLMNRIACLNCRKVSTKTDSFYDLQLGIPTKKQRAKLIADYQSILASPAHPASESPGPSPSGSVGSVYPDTPTNKRGGSSSGSGYGGAQSHHSLLSNISGLLGLSRDRPISLVDCLAMFCSVETLSGDDRYHCDNCKAKHDCHKTLSIIELPEIVCVQIKRFRYDSYFGSKISAQVDFPLRDLDLAPFVFHPSGQVPNVTKYDLVSLINHRGGLNGGHYVSYCRNRDNNDWYLYDDSRVTQVSAAEVGKAEAYVLFYQKQAVTPPREHAALRGLLKSTSSDDRYCYLSSRWYHRWATMAEPGPVDNSPFVCPHGLISRDVNLGADPLVSVVKRVPERFCKALIEKYGGGPALYGYTPCTDCENEMRLLNIRRKKEKKAIQECDCTQLGPNEYWHLIDSDWLKKWHEFTVMDSSAPDPGPVSNYRLLQSNGEPRKGLAKAKHYRGVNRKVWEVFVGQYGGGPHIRRKVLDIYASPPPSGE